MSTEQFAIDYAMTRPDYTPNNSLGQAVSRKQEWRFARRLAAGMTGGVIAAALLEQVPREMLLPTLGFFALVSIATLGMNKLADSNLVRQTRNAPHIRT